MAIKICLDAGHYGQYNHSPAVKSYCESEMNWKLHNKLADALKAYGIEVIKTRAELDKDLGLQARGKTAKGCDLFLSIHSNSVGSRVDENVDYVVVYVPLNGSGDAIGKKLAECIASTMGTKQKPYTKTRKSENGNWDYYGVINGAVSVGVPGLILEHSFHTNTKMTNWLLNDANLDKMALAEAKVIAEHYGLTKVTETPAEKPAETPAAKPVETPAENTQEVMYFVQCGAYSKLENAKNKVAALKAAGFDAIIKTEKK